MVARQQLDLKPLPHQIKDEGRREYSHGLPRLEGRWTARVGIEAVTWDWTPRCCYERADGFECQHAKEWLAVRHRMAADVWRLGSEKDDVGDCIVGWRGGSLS